ncbi:unnamed protein product [Nezara viridula]|uniref:Uncharacterized protein n=1 Tax=Nezara viridula TaxID=85310 RepID=A0A9P0H111_NEZVI|nr:unnamed protein product [Nezara viridula]
MKHTLRSLTVLRLAQKYNSSCKRIAQCSSPFLGLVLPFLTLRGTNRSSLTWNRQNETLFRTSIRQMPTTPRSSTALSSSYQDLTDRLTNSLSHGTTSCSPNSTIYLTLFTAHYLKFVFLVVTPSLKAVPAK